MSRFSKSEAEARGWVFVHSEEEYTVVTSGTQGETRYTPPTYRAEKYVSLPGQGASLVNEEAETMGLLLEKINAYEEQFAAKTRDLTPAPVEIAGQPVDDAGLALRSVHTAEGPITEAEWAARDDTDALYLGKEEGMVFYGPQPVAEDAVDAKAEIKRELENEATAEPDVGDTEQVEVDLTQTVIDSPGGGPQGRYVVREGEDPLTDTLVRKERETHDEENAGEPGPQVYASEDPAVLGTVTVEEGPSAGEVRNEAQEEQANEIRDEKGAAAVDKPENQDAVREAGAQAEQDAKDNAEQDSSGEQSADGADVDGEKSPVGSPADEPVADQPGEIEESASGPEGRVDAVASKDDKPKRAGDGKPSKE